MKKLLTIALLLTASLTMWGQTDLKIVEPGTEPIIAEMTFCLPIVEANDTLVVLICGGVRIEMPMEKINGELTIIIHPSDDGPVNFKETVNWYLAPKSYYRDSLGINLY